jgi:hypothetical protein
VSESDGDDGTSEAPTRWAAPIAAVVLAAAGALALGAWALSADDAPGRVLAGVGALALALAALFGGLARPRLAVDDDGLTVRGPLRTSSWPWAGVDAVRVVRARRLGLPTAYVELEARDATGDERLLVLGRLELGADPVEVAEVLQGHRAAAGRRGHPGGQ